MQESDFTNLVKRQEITSFYYHAAGMVEAHGRIRDHLVKLDKWYGKDWRKTAAILTSLWVEIYDHLDYHLKELRVPFSELTRISCENFERTDPEGFKRWNEEAEADDIESL